MQENQTSPTNIYVCFTLCFFVFLNARNVLRGDPRTWSIFILQNFHGLKSSSRNVGASKLEVNLFLAQDQSYPKLVHTRKPNIPNKHLRLFYPLFLSYSYESRIILVLRGNPCTTWSVVILELFIPSDLALRPLVRLCRGNQIRNLFLAQNRSYPLIS